MKTPGALKAAIARGVPLTVPQVLAGRAAAEPGRVAITQGAATLTMERWHRRAVQVGVGLLAEGVQPGDRVGLIFSAQHWIDYAIAYAGAVAAGAVAVPISDRAAPAEIDYMLGHCAAKAVLHSPGVSAPTALRAEVGEFTADGDLPRVRPADLAQILYTSGTTGRPKGVAASHANVTFGCALRTPQRRLAHSRLFLHAFPIGTNAGQTMLFNALDAAPGMLVASRFAPGNFARLIETHRVGTVFVVPAMAIELLRAEVAADHDLSSVVLLGSTAAALPPSVAAELAAALPGAAIANYYTSTEAAPAQTTMLFDPDRPASLGRPADGGSLRVTDPDGVACPVGVPGEVWLRSPTTPRAYYGDDDAGAGVFADGWTRMGDVGYLDGDGYLYLIDRDSDVIKSGAYKVSTVQVEAALHEHPDIVEAAVVGIAHPVLGMTPAAAIVADRLIVSAQLRAFLAGHLAPHELPTRLLQVGTLPRNNAGKVLKSRLRELFDTMDGR
jgi:acyl-CoA synthetase (AMP-forming)/AMP-acid ligase II